MLAVAALLLALVAEHRAHVPYLHRLGELVEAVLDVGVPAARVDVVGAPKSPVGHTTPRGKYGFVSSSSIACKTDPGPTKRRVVPFQKGITFLTDTSISSQEAPEMSVRPTLPGSIRSPTIWSRPTTNVTDPGECPGVCSTWKVSPAITRSSPSLKGS